MHCPCSIWSLDISIALLDGWSKWRLKNILCVWAGNLSLETNTRRLNNQHLSVFHSNFYWNNWRVLKHFYRFVNGNATGEFKLHKLPLLSPLSFEFFCVTVNSNFPYLSRKKWSQDNFAIYCLIDPFILPRPLPILPNNLKSNMI